MVEIDKLTKIERDILTLAADNEGTLLNFKTIEKNFKLNRNEVEQVVNGLIEKNMAEIKHYDYDPPDVIFCKMEYGISKGRYVNLKDLEDAYMADMALRDRVCP
ncbi:MAG: hypothetical protein FWB86_14365 [Treponema sp.]|nr:hypothetical protein [Treponema sp.]